MLNTLKRGMPFGLDAFPKNFDVSAREALEQAGDLGEKARIHLELGLYLARQSDFTSDEAREQLNIAAWQTDNLLVAHDAKRLLLTFDVTRTRFVIDGTLKSMDAARQASSTQFKCVLASCFENEDFEGALLTLLSMNDTLIMLLLMHCTVGVSRGGAASITNLADFSGIDTILKMAPNLRDDEGLMARIEHVRQRMAKLLVLLEGGF